MCELEKDDKIVHAEQVSQNCISIVADETMHISWDLPYLEAVTVSNPK